MTEKEISKQITRYINGELNDREEDLLWEEFLKNHDYYQLFETELNLTDLYRNKNFRIGKSDRPNQVNESKRSYTAWYVSVAAVILLSSILYIFSFQSETEPSSYALSKIELTQMLGSDIFRDESQDVTQLDQQINRSLSLALAGNSEQATDILSRLMSESLTDIQKIRIRFNLGILAYNDGEFDRSLDLFTEINELGVPGTADYIYENTQWYVANIHLKQGNFDRSEKLLSQLASGSGIHATKAEELLSSISD